MAIAATVSRNVATITKHRHIVTSVIKKATGNNPLETLPPEITPREYPLR